MRKQSRNVSLWRLLLLCAAIAATATVFITPCTRATTIHVPTDQPTIQAGVNAANEGDTVLVAPGTYTGPGNYDILIDGKGLVVISESGPAVTIIDCEQNGRGFLIRGPANTDTEISGLTIANGEMDAGAGLWLTRASATVKFCIFRDCIAEDAGAVLVSGDGEEAVASLVNCTFVGNIATNLGGVILARWGATVDFISCLTYRNKTLSGKSLYHPYAGNPITLTCCNEFGNEPGDWFYHVSGQYGIDGNIRVDPMFCDAESGDFGLHAESPMRPEASPCGELVGALGVSCSNCYDVDGDGLCAIDDNCPVISNVGQEDTDEDGTGDACEDDDGDSYPNALDNCADVVNWGQEDKDFDGIGDVCDDDIDGDGVLNESDNCPVNYNPGQEDGDEDGRGDVCCCIGRVGDANGSGDDEPTIGDISVLIDAKFITGTCDDILICLQEADFNQSGGCNPTCNDITIGDIASLIEYIFVNGPGGPYAPDCLDCP
jgi:hypothetical protein